MSDKKPAVQWFKATKGIRYRVHPTRKHGKRFDRYYALQYKLGGEVFNEAVGWASGGVTQESCERILLELRENWRTGKGPQTYSEMKEAAAKARAELKAQEAAEQNRLITVADYFENHFLPFAKRTKKEKSWGMELSHFKHWINPAIGQLPVVEIGLSQWELLVKSLDKGRGRGKLSKRTQEYITGTLRRILHHAKDRKFAVDLPTGGQIGVKAPKNNRRQRVLTQEECESILAELEKRNIHAWRITKFAMLTGCRASEAFNLCWQHVDMEGKWQNADEKGKQIKLVETKNGDDRMLSMSPAVEELLTSIGPGKPGEHVFRRSSGAPYREAPFEYRTVIKHLALNEGRARLDRADFHSIRHTVATRHAKSLDVRSLMDVMGWRSVEMAIRYIHSDEDKKKKAMEELEGIYTPQSKAKVIPFPADKAAGE